MTQPASAAQIVKIHALGRNAGLSEEARRDVIAGVAGGKRSSKELSIVEARAVIDRLAALAGKSGAPDLPQQGGGRAAPAKRLAKGALQLDGSHVGKIRALWISLHHLGVIHDPTDVAMVAFVKRQTRLEHERWASKALEDPAAARKVIEALKKIAERHGVDWKAEEPGSAGAKRAVYLAIRRALTAAGVDTAFVAFPGRSFAPMDPAELDALTKAAGARLQKARAEANPGVPELAAPSGQIGRSRPGRGA